jgi:hypothetical protein
MFRSEIHLRLRGKLVQVQHGPATVSEKEGYKYSTVFLTWEGVTNR